MGVTRISRREFLGGYVAMFRIIQPRITQITRISPAAQNPWNP